MSFDLPPSYAIALLLLLSFLLFAAEVFLPGLVLGSLGAISAITAIAWCYATYGMAIGSFTLLGTLVLGTVLFLVYLQNFQRLPFARRLVNRASTTGESAEPKDPLLGKTGISLSPLRPSGIAKIDGRRLDVVAETSFIESGVKIQVVETDGSRIVVRGPQS